MQLLVQLAMIGVLIAVLIYFIKKLKIAFTRLYITLQGPFFCASSGERVKDILKIVSLKPTDKVVDLGSGDGRVLIALAKKFKVNAVGYEIDPILVKDSQEAVAQEKLSKKIKIIDKSFWGADISKFDVIVVYCVPRFLKRLEKKLAKEMKPTAQVVSVFFKFPTWKPVKELGDIRLYRKSP